MNVRHGECGSVWKSAHHRAGYMYVLCVCIRMHAVPDCLPRSCEGFSGEELHPHPHHNPQAFVGLMSPWRHIPAHHRVGRATVQPARLLG